MQGAEQNEPDLAADRSCLRIIESAGWFRPLGCGDSRGKVEMEVAMS